MGIYRISSSFAYSGMVFIPETEPAAFNSEEHPGQAGLKIKDGF
jgi:hypothetical protein